MSIMVTYRCRNYDPANVRKRYIRSARLINDYVYIEVGDDLRYDMLQGFIPKSAVPKEIGIKAELLEGQAFGYVEWK